MEVVNCFSFYCLQLITTYATNFITKTQLEALFTHMRVSGRGTRVGVAPVNIFSPHLSLLQNEYYQRPMDLVRVVQHCLFKESELVERQEHLNVSHVVLSEKGES